MAEARTISIFVARPWRTVYDTMWRPERFAEWASGMSQADLRFEDEMLRATGPDGPVEIEFTGHNAFGVMDHTIHLGGGRSVLIPLRVVANRGGAEVMLTLLRDPDTSDAVFDRDVAWVERDLVTLKRLLEA